MADEFENLKKQVNAKLIDHSSHKKRFEYLRTRMAELLIVEIHKTQSKDQLTILLVDIESFIKNALISLEHYDQVLTALEDAQANYGQHQAR